jgi:hypothetical protein
MPLSQRVHIYEGTEILNWQVLYRGRPVRHRALPIVAQLLISNYHVLSGDGQVMARRWCGGVGQCLQGFRAVRNSSIVPMKVSGDSNTRQRDVIVYTVGLCKEHTHQGPFKAPGHRPSMIN